MGIKPLGLLRFYVPNESSVGRTPPSFRSLRIAQSGMSAQLARMETAATNIANAETTRVGGPGSGPYQRKIVPMAEARSTDLTAAVPPLPPLHTEGPILAPDATDPTSGMTGVEVGAIEVDASEGPLVYDPGHPDANAEGYVRYPNVRVTEEIAGLMEARRLYEANASVFQAAKLMLRRALDI